MTFISEIGVISSRDFAYSEMPRLCTLYFYIFRGQILIENHGNNELYLPLVLRCILLLLFASSYSCNSYSKNTPDYIQAIFSFFKNANVRRHFDPVCGVIGLNYLMLKWVMVGTLRGRDRLPPNDSMKIDDRWMRAGQRPTGHSPLSGELFLKKKCFKNSKIN